MATLGHQTFILSNANYIQMSGVVSTVATPNTDEQRRTRDSSLKIKV